MSKSVIAEVLDMKVAGFAMFASALGALEPPTIHKFWNPMNGKFQLNFMTILTFVYRRSMCRSFEKWGYRKPTELALEACGTN